MEYKQKLLDLFSYTKRKNKQLSIMVEKKEKYLSMGDDESNRIIGYDYHVYRSICRSIDYV